MLFTVQLFSEETQYTWDKFEAEHLQDVIDHFVAEGYEVLSVTDADDNEYVC